jgi:hypothetical protein
MTIDLLTQERIYVFRGVVEDAVSEETTDGARIASGSACQPASKQVSTRQGYHRARSKVIHETATFPLKSMNEEALTSRVLFPGM